MAPHPERPTDSQDETPHVVVSWIRQYVLVVEFLGALAVLGYLGYRADLKYGSGPWGLFAGLMLALATSVYRMIREGQRTK